MTEGDDDNVNKDSDGDEDNTDASQNLSDNIFCTFPDETGLVIGQRD